jgi:hypothetical protein
VNFVVDFGYPGSEFLMSFVFCLLQRDDMDVLDEPLYANFLRVTGVDRPYREELLSKMVRLERCLSSL